MASNVNTDIITPAERYVRAARHEFGEIAFAPWRYREDGSDDPDFVLNQAPWRGAPILLAGPNFGCGSSREGAVWALNQIGIRCIIAPGFGGIFANNCYQNGMLPLALPAETVEAFAEIARTQSEAPFTVDLERCVVVPPNGEPVPFQVDELRRQSLLTGLDDIGMTLARRAEIDAFQSADRATRPWVWMSETQR
jgi:3-isopropylmalate/(R)-2-methylmalate dehydratase small subunit